MTEQLITKTADAFDDIAAVLVHAAADLRRSAFQPPSDDGESAAPPPSDEDDTSTTITEAPTQPPAATLGSGGRSWTQVGESEVQASSWAAAHGNYDHVEFWQTDDEGPFQQLVLCYTAADPGRDWYGRPRGYWIVQDMVNRRLGSELAVFVEADQPNDLVAVIRGKGPTGRAMFDPGDELPAGYENLTVDVFHDRVIGPQAYGKLAVVAVDGDRQAMLNHAAIQRGR